MEFPALLLLKRRRRLGAAAAGGADHLWSEWVSPGSPIYDAIIKATTPLVVLGFVIWAASWARDVIHQYDNPTHWQKAVWPLAVAMLFFNHGQLLAESTTFGKVITYNVANGILNITGSNILIKQQIQNRELVNAYQRYYSQESSRCNLSHLIKL